MIVTKPTESTTLVDILISVDMKRMELQFKGGLFGGEIIGIFTMKGETENCLPALHFIQSINVQLLYASRAFANMFVGGLFFLFVLPPIVFH